MHVLLLQGYVQLTYIGVDIAWEWLLRLVVVEAPLSRSLKVLILQFVLIGIERDLASLKRGPVGSTTWRLRFAMVVKFVLHILSLTLIVHSGCSVPFFHVINIWICLNNLLSPFPGHLSHGTTRERWCLILLDRPPSYRFETGFTLFFFFACTGIGATDTERRFLRRWWGVVMLSGVAEGEHTRVTHQDHWLHWFERVK